MRWPSSWRTPDIAAFRSVFADDYMVWHNSDQKIETGGPEALSTR
jgi:hypothetical protein